MNSFAKKSTALILAVVIIVGLFPHGLYAAGTESAENAAPASLTPADTSDDYMTLSKTAEHTGEDTWNVTLTVTPKDTTLKPAPSEVILILDHSGSMASENRWETLKKVLIEQGGLFESLNDLNARISIMTFGNTPAKVLNDGAFYHLGDGASLEKLKSDINAIPKPYETTDMRAAFVKAKEILDTLPAGGRPEVIFLTDGLCEPYGMGQVNVQSPKDDVHRAYVQEMQAAIADIQGRASLYGISFDNKAKGDADLRYLLGAENVYTSDDYTSLKQNFQDIQINLRTFISDPMSAQIAATQILSTEVSNAGSITYPAAEIKDNHVVWTPEPGHSLSPGQTLTIRYSAQLKSDQLPALFDANGALPLNGAAKVNYLVDGEGGEPHSLNFPLPQDIVEISKLTTTTYLNDVPIGEPEVHYDIVYQDKTRTLTLPEEDAAIENAGTTYTYAHSRYDGAATKGSAVPLTAGAHTLDHYYYAADARGDLVYHANGGTFDDGSTDAALNGLPPATHTLWTKDGQGKVPSGQRAWPSHAAENAHNVVMVGWTTENTNGKIYGKSDSLPELISEAAVTSGARTDVYAVWATDENNDGVPDGQQHLVYFEVADGHGVVTPAIAVVQPVQTLAEALNAAQPIVQPDKGWHFTGQWLLKGGDGTALNGDELLLQAPADGATYIALVAADAEPAHIFHVTVVDSYADSSGAGDYAADSSVTIDAGQRPGYRFSGWRYDDESLSLSDANARTTTFTMPPRDVVVTATWVRITTPGDGGKPPVLNTEDHFSYVVGYPVDYHTGAVTTDEALWPVKPQGNITRAEVATIFYRLLKDEVRQANTTNISPFSDVHADDWYGTTVATLAKMDIIGGYEDGSFRPNAPISRAEFAAIAARFFEEAEVDYNKDLFTDITGDEWYADVVAAAAKLGLIGGYPDGSVHPQARITRAEACAVVNRTLDRRPHEQHLLPAGTMRTWPDNQPGAWYYADMQEATNGHEYEWITEDSTKVEKWATILPDNTWTGR